MRSFHLYAGYTIVGGWGLVFLWGCVLWLLRRDANRVYWWVAAGLQILIAVQVVAGGVLLVAGGRPEWLHYFYGAVGPAMVLAIAHVLTRGLTKPPYHSVFTVASFVVFGMTSRALMTGLGAG